MMDVTSMVFTGGEVKRLKHRVPDTVEVDVKVDKLQLKAVDTLVLDFTYSIKYGPDVGSVKITGIAFCQDSPARIKEVLAYFKKKKMLPMEHGAAVLNMINANAGMNSVFMIRPFNLLPPFMPPMIASEPGKPAPKGIKSASVPKKTSSVKAKKKKK